jgi:UDP-N-acetylmuramate--alanine ligase
VVYTAAVPPHHPELEAARLEGIPVLTRAEALGVAVSGGKVVGVAGTHGKTTVTAMIAEALAASGVNPTALVGGRIAAWDGNVRFGGDEFYVVEADEFDRSFLRLTANVAVVNNVEADHWECYGSVSELEGAFAQFASTAEHVLVGADDGGANRVAMALSAPVWRVGLAENADVRLTDIRRDAGRNAATVHFPGGQSIDLDLAVPGLHNLRNGAMALGVTATMDADVEAAAQRIGQFTGVARRFEVLGTYRGVTVVDDYAHHPTEIAATLGAARQRYPAARLVAVLQPHLFSRTEALGEAMGIALAMADVAVVTDVYAAREQPIRGVTGKLVVKAARRAGADVYWIPALESLVAELEALIVNGDVVVTLGAGDITEVGRELVRRLAGVAA